VLYQTMYLVATAMGLAPCGVSCGNADLFARAAGLEYYTETSVGVRMLGGRGDVSERRWELRRPAPGAGRGRDASRSDYRGVFSEVITVVRPLLAQAVFARTPMAAASCRASSARHRRYVQGDGRSRTSGATSRAEPPRSLLISAGGMRRDGSGSS
jgi:hypothetical protein